MTYATAEGLGLTFNLSPDETLVASTGLRLVQLNWGPSSYAYVTPADGSQADALLHVHSTTDNNYGGQPTISRDNRYAVFTGRFSGAYGIYATDLQAPGTAVRIDSMGPSIFFGNPVLAGDSRTAFWTEAAPSTHWVSLKPAIAAMRRTATASPFAVGTAAASLS